MKSLIDFSLFLFNCIDISNSSKDLIFTYKTSKQGFNKLNKNFIDILKNICNNLNFYSQLSKRKHDHPIDIDDIKTKDRIAYIFETQKYPKKWIEQYILASVIYQLEFNSTKERLFYLVEQDANREYFIIKPLFLDLNHSIIPNHNNSRDNIRYQICFICNTEDCGLKIY